MIGARITTELQTLAALIVARAYIDADLVVLIDSYSTGGARAEAALNADEKMHVMEARYALGRIDAAIAAVARSNVRI